MTEPIEIEYLETPGIIRKHGQTKGRTQYEVCLLKDNPETKFIREAWLGGRLSHIELVLDDGRRIPVLKQPYRSGRGELCFLLHMWLDDLWEEIYMKYRFKPVKVRIYLTREIETKTGRGDPS